MKTGILPWGHLEFRYVKIMIVRSTIENIDKTSRYTIFSSYSIYIFDIISLKILPFG